MDSAWQAGIGFFDAAPSYGGGRSESWIGRWRSEREVPVLLSTKVYWSVTGDPADRGLSRERILREVEGSLGRLRDRPHRHVPHARARPGHADRGDAARARGAGARGQGARDRREQRRRRAAGAGARDELSGSASRGSSGFRTSTACSGAGPSGTSCRCARARGSGSRRSARCAAAGSPAGTGGANGPRRLAHDTAPGAVLRARELDTFDRLERFYAAAAERGVEPAALAIAWVLSRPEVTAVVVGPRSPAQLQPALTAAELSLSQRERDELAGLFA